MHQTNHRGHKAPQLGSWLRVGLGLIPLSVLAACHPLNIEGDLLSLKIPRCDRKNRGSCVRITASTGLLIDPSSADQPGGAQKSILTPSPMMGDAIYVLYTRAADDKSGESLIAQLYSTADGTCSPAAVASGTLLASYAWNGAVAAGTPVIGDHTTPPAPPTTATPPATRAAPPPPSPSP